MRTIRCAFCSKPVDPEAGSTYRAIFGWEDRRRRGPSVFLREETGEYAHASCVKREISDRKYQVTPGQTSFL